MLLANIFILNLANIFYLICIKILFTLLTISTFIYIFIFRLFLRPHNENPSRIPISNDTCLPFNLQTVKETRSYDREHMIPIVLRMNDSLSRPLKLKSSLVFPQTVAIHN